MTDLSKSPDRIAGMFDAIAGTLRFPQSPPERRHRSPLAAARDPVAGADRAASACSISAPAPADLAIAARSARARRRARRRRRFRRRDARRRPRRSCARAACATASTLVRGDATRIPRRGRGSVDAVTIAFGIRNVEDTGGACAEMHRVLAPGGRLAILEFAMPTTPVVRGGVPLVFQPRPAAHRPAGLAARRAPTAICRPRSARSRRRTSL